MATYEVTTADGSVYEVETADEKSSPSNAVPKEQTAGEVAKMAASSLLGNNLIGETIADPQAAFKKYSNYYPVVGTALGGPFGAGVGQIIKNTEAQILGDPSAENNPLKAGAQAALQTGAAGVLDTPGAKRIVNGAVNLAAKAAAPVGRFLSKAGELVTNVPAKSFQRLAKDPTALFIPRTLKGAGERFGKKMADLGINLEPTDAEVYDPMMSTARRNALGFWDRVRNGVQSTVKVPTQVEQQLPIVNEMGKPITKTVTQMKDVPVKVPYKPDAGEIIKAKRATDTIIEGTPRKAVKKLRDLYQRKNELTEMLSNVEGKAQEAATEYSRSALAAQFRKLLPETQTGKMSYVRNVLVPMAARTVLAPVLSAPITAGLATSLGSMGVQGAAKAIQSPAIQKAILARLLVNAQQPNKNGGQ